MDGRFVAYYRVSRQSQGMQGLGMDAQKTAVASFLNGGDWTLVGEFTEVESGKKSDRIELQRAFACARQHNATLVIAKLDRLSRNAHFLTGLMEAGVDFLCCDMPYATPLTITILAAVAQDERERTVKRTRDALAEIKGKIARGEKHVGKTSGKPVERLGGPKPITAATASLGRQKRSETAAAFASNVAPTAKALKDGGMTLAGVAARLNELKVTTPRGAQWTPMAVKRVLDRVA